MKCLICNCEDHTPCLDQHTGPCSWHTKELCSHCADPEIFKNSYRELAERPEPLTIQTIYYALWKAGQRHVEITPAGTNEVGIALLGKQILFSANSYKAKFFELVEAWFPKFKKNEHNLNSYIVNLNEMATIIEFDERLAEQEQASTSAIGFSLLPNDVRYTDSPDTGWPECTCSRCGKMIQEEECPIRIMPSKDELTPAEIEAAPGGYEYRFCKACGDDLFKRIVPKPEHYVSHRIVYDPHPILVVNLSNTAYQGQLRLGDGHQEFVAIDKGPYFLIEEK